MEDKLHDIFRRKLGEIADRIGGIDFKSTLRLVEAWNEYLSNLDGVERRGKLLGLVIEKEGDKAYVKDPLVIGGNQSYIIIPKELATKIAMLGALP